MFSASPVAIPVAMGGARMAIVHAFESWSVECGQNVQSTMKATKEAVRSAVLAKPRPSTTAAKSLASARRRLKGVQVLESFTAKCP
jgi:hypothetical protein